MGAGAVLADGCETGVSGRRCIACFSSGEQTCRLFELMLHIGFVALSGATQAKRDIDLQQQLRLMDQWMSNPRMATTVEAASPSLLQAAQLQEREAVAALRTALQRGHDQHVEMCDLGAALCADFDAETSKVAFPSGLCADLETYFG